MVALNFNASGVKPNTGFEPVPSGTYPVTITKSEEKPTKSGNGSYLELSMTIQGGEHNGKTVIDRLNLRNPNQQAVDIAFGTLSAICHVTGRMQVQDSQQLHGVPFQVIVIKKEREDQPGTFSNEVKGYKDINGNDPGFSGTVANNNAQPGWANNGGPGPGPQNQQQQPQNQQQPDNTQQQQPQNGGGQPAWAQQGGGNNAGTGTAQPPAWAQQ